MHYLWCVWCPSSHNWLMLRNGNLSPSQARALSIIFSKFPINYWIICPDMQTFHCPVGVIKFKKEIVTGVTGKLIPPNYTQGMVWHIISEPIYTLDIVQVRFMFAKPYPGYSLTMIYIRQGIDLSQVNSGIGYGLAATLDLPQWFLLEFMCVQIVSPFSDSNILKYFVNISVPLPQKMILLDDTCPQISSRGIKLQYKCTTHGNSNQTYTLFIIFSKVKTFMVLALILCAKVSDKKSPHLFLDT